MKKLEINYLEDLHGGYDCELGVKQAIGLCFLALLFAPGGTIACIAMTTVNAYNGCYE